MANLIKVLGIGATVVGMGASMLNDYVSNKKMEQTIDEKVNEALARRFKDEEDDEDEEES